MTKLTETAKCVFFIIRGSPLTKTIKNRYRNAIRPFTVVNSRKNPKNQTNRDWITPGFHIWALSDTNSYLDSMKIETVKVMKTQFTNLPFIMVIRFRF
jgi:hypothetical protein